jgi:CrcB protein
MYSLKSVLILFLGGGLGTVLRYMISRALNPLSPNFVWGTFGINILGSLLLGLLVGYSLKYPTISQQAWFPFLAVGLCGGFTTFSSLALENYNFIKSGQFLEFSLYLSASVILGIGAIAAGIFISK